MKKQNPPVCPWGTTFAQAMDGRTGRKCRTQEGQRKQINDLLDTMQQAGDFWTLELLRRLLIRLTAFDDIAFTISLIIFHMTGNSSYQMERLFFWSNRIHFPQASNSVKQLERK